MMQIYTVTIILKSDEFLPYAASDEGNALRIAKEAEMIFGEDIETWIITSGNIDESPIRIAKENNYMH